MQTVENTGRIGGLLESTSCSNSFCMKFKSNWGAYQSNRRSLQERRSSSWLLQEFLALNKLSDDETMAWKDWWSNDYSLNMCLLSLFLEFIGSYNGVSFVLTIYIYVYVQAMSLIWEMFLVMTRFVLRQKSVNHHPVSHKNLKNQKMNSLCFVCHSLLLCCELVTFISRSKKHSPHFRHSILLLPVESVEFWSLPRLQCVAPQHKEVLFIDFRRTFERAGTLQWDGFLQRKEDGRRCKMHDNLTWLGMSLYFWSRNFLQQIASMSKAKLLEKALLEFSHF